MCASWEGVNSVPGQAARLNIICIANITLATVSSPVFYRAMLYIRGTSHGPVSVCLSVCVCLSQAGVLLKRQNVGSHKQHHTIPQGL